MKIFIGYEPDHPEMFDVCRKSILRFNSTHEIIAIKKSEISGYSRPFQNESTDFAFTRFLVPYLCDYEGEALFCDGDFLWFCDPEEVMDYFSDEHTVHVVKHPEFLIKAKKMKGKRNRSYPRKYWSSLMLFNNPRCKELTVEYVNEAPAGALHELSWADSIGDLPAQYNAMINYYKFKNPKAIHFTDGGPWLNINDNSEYTAKWMQMLKEM